MKSPLLLLLILLVFVSKQAYAQTQGAYAIGVMQDFDPFSDCHSSNPKPSFNYAYIGLKNSSATEPFDTKKIVGAKNLNKEFYFDDVLFWRNTAFFTTQKGGEEIDRISVKTRTEFMPHDTNINEEFELKIKQGTIRKAYSASDPCSNNFNLSGNREGYTMTTTIFIDDPVDLSAALPTRYSAASGVLTLKTNKFYKSEKNEFELQVTLQSDDQWANPRTIKGVSFSPGRDINLTYEKIAGAKSDKDTKYFEWLGRGLNFRVVKKLGNGVDTYGQSVSNVIFFPDGIQFNIHHTRRTACSKESTVVMYVTLDNSDDAKILAGNDSVRWKMRVKKTPHEDDQASSFYTCTFDKEGDKYKIRATLLGGSENDGDILNVEQSDLLYGELMLEEINKNKDHCKRIFVIPPKPNRVTINQDTPIYGIDMADGSGKNYYHLLSDKVIYATLNINDDYGYAHERSPYYIMNGEDTVSVIHDLPYGYEDKKDSLDAVFEAHFTYMLDHDNKAWSLYLDGKYNSWYNSIKDGVKHTGSVPTMDSPSVSSSGFGFYLMSPNRQYFIGRKSFEYYKFKFVFSNDYLGSYLSGSNTSAESSIWHLDNTGSFIKITNGIVSNPPIKITVTTDNIITGAGSKYLFTKTNNGITSLHTVSLDASSIGDKKELVNNGKLPFYSSDGSILLYTKSNNSGLYSYRYGTSTAISARMIRKIRYIASDNSYCIFDSEDGNTYKLDLNIPSKEYFLYKKSDTSGWPRNVYGWLQSFKALYKKQWLLEQCGYRFTFVGMKANTTYNYHLMDGDGCPSDITNSSLAGGKGIRVDIPEQPNITHIVVEKPSNNCASNGKLRLTYVSEGIDDYYYSNGTRLKKGSSLEFSDLKVQDTLYFNTAKGSLAHTEYIDFNKLAGTPSGISYITVARTNKYSPNGEVKVSLASASAMLKKFILTNANNPQLKFESTYTDKSFYNFPNLPHGKYTASIIFKGDCAPISEPDIEVPNNKFSFSVTPIPSNSFTKQGEFTLNIENGTNSDIIWSGNASGIVSGENSNFTSHTFPAKGGSYTLIGSLSLGEGVFVTDTVRFNVEAPSFDGVANIDYYEKVNVDGVVKTVANFELSLLNTLRLGDKALTLKRNGVVHSTSTGSINIKALTVGSYNVFLDNGYDEVEIFDFTVNNQSINSSTTIVPPVCSTGNATVTINEATGGFNGGVFKYGTDGLSFNDTKKYGDIKENEFAYSVQSSISINDNSKTNPIVVNKTFTKRFKVDIERPLPVSARLVSHDISCNGADDGSLSLIDLTGGNKKTTYLFKVDELGSLNAETATQTGLTAGKHTVYLRDEANKCEEVILGQFTIKEPLPLKIKKIDVVQPTCELDNGSISVEVEGGNKAYRYTWKRDEADFYYSGDDFLPDSITQFGDSLQYGSYHLNVSDPLGCSVDSVMVLDNYKNPYFVATSASTIDAKCFGDSNGEITVGEVKGSSALNRLVLLREGIRQDSVYSLPANFTNLSPGKYSVKLYDTNLCESNQDLLTIHQPEYRLFINVDTIRPVLHKGEASAYIGANVIGGNTGSKELILKDGLGVILETKEAINSIRYDFEKLAKDTYTLETIDRKGCLYVGDVITIEEREPLSFEIVSKRDAQCKARTGTFTIEGKGGWGGYKYKKSESHSYTEENVFSGLRAGKYIVSVQDQMGAVFTDVVEILEPKDFLELHIEDSQLPSCANNGSVELLSTGGTAPYQVMYADKSETANVGVGETHRFLGMEAGSYTFSTIDANGCIYNLDVLLSDENILRDLKLVPTAYQSAAGVNDGALNATFLGGQAPFTYTWFDEGGHVLNATGPTLSDVASGYYQLFIKDNSDCEGIKKQTYLPGAYDRAISIEDKGDETYYLAKNGYAVLYFEQENYQSAKIQSPDGEITNYAIADVSSLFDADGKLNLNGLAGGEYNITVLDKNGEKYFANIEIEPYNEFVFGKIDVKPALKRDEANGSASISVKGGAPDYTFAWKNLDHNIEAIGIEEGATAKLENVNAGKYELTVTDRYNNEISTQIDILQPEKDLTISIVDYKHESCKTYEDAFVKLAAEGGWGSYQFKHADDAHYSYGDQWGDLDVRTHKFYVTDEWEVLDSISFNISEPAFLHASVSLIDSVSCNGEVDGKIEFNVTGGTAPYRFALSTRAEEWRAGTTSTKLAKGAYTYYFTDANNCVGQDTINVNMPEPAVLDFALTDVIHTTCNTDNGKIAVAMQGGSAPYRYEWRNAEGQIVSTDNQAVNLVQNAYYKLDVYDYHNCHQFYEQVINPSTVPVVNSIKTTPVLCYGDSNGTAEIAAVTPAIPYAPYSFTWSNGQKGENSNGWASGINSHSVTVTDDNSCESTKYFSVETPKLLRFSISAFKDAHCYGYDDGYIEVNPKGGVGGYKYLWSNGVREAKADKLSKGEYSLQLTDANNCTYNQSFTINEPDEALIDLGDDIKICPGNTITLDGQDYPGHRWSSSNAPVLSEERYFLTSEARDYYLRVTNEIGCYAYDTISITIGNDALKADFLLSSEAYVGDALTIYELSNLPLDSMRWDYDSTSFLTLNNETTADYILQLETMGQGMFNIGLHAYSGGCVSKVIKQVEVFMLDSEREDISELGYKEPLIQSLKVTPNPTDGNFDVLIGLREEADVKVDVFSVNQAAKVDEQKRNGLKEYTVGYRLSNLNTGVYLVVVTAEKERKQVKIIIK